jgi:murein L,D-transpeptidase YafK
MRRSFFAASFSCAFSVLFLQAFGGTVLSASPDSIVVFKQKHEMCVYKHKELLKVYKVALGLQPSGAKQYEGDMRTPEGLYFINNKNEHSLYHKSLGISYPAAKDRAIAKKLGRRPGGDIKIHGLPNGHGYVGELHRLKDWTHGCIALTDEEIDELYAHVAVGTPVNILP